MGLGRDMVGFMISEYVEVLATYIYSNIYLSHV